MVAGPAALRLGLAHPGYALRLRWEVWFHSAWQDQLGLMAGQLLLRIACHPTSACWPASAGRGGEPWANANLVRQPRDEESWPSSAAEEVEADVGAQVPVQAAPAQQAGEAPGSSGSMQLAEGASLVQAPAGDGSQAPSLVADSMLPAPALPPLPCAEQPGSPAIPAKRPAGSAQLPGQQQQQQQPVAALKVTLRGSPGQGTGLKERLPLPGAGSGRQAPLCAPSPSALWGATGGGGGSPKRGPAVLTSHLPKELVSLQDELLVKTDLADALACKVGAALDACVTCMCSAAACCTCAVQQAWCPPGAEPPSSPTRLHSAQHGCSA